MQLISNAMLIEYTKINKKGITRMQLLITFGLNDLGHVTGMRLVKERSTWKFLQIHRAHKNVGGTNRLKERR
jgi:hypothetical protein